MANSKIIVVEGSQGAGKTTITDYIRHTLPYTNLYRLCGTSDSTLTGKKKAKEMYQDLLEYMKKMDFTVLSSISEGQPLTILESMAAGRPCVATKVGNCVGLLEEPINGTGSAGFCCTPMMPEELANSMEKLCMDKALRREMGENGKKRVLARYTLDKMLNSYHEIYREALEHGRDRI